MQVPQTKMSASPLVAQPAPEQQPVAAPPRRSRFWWVALGLVVVAGAAALWMRQAEQANQAASTMAITRTAAVRGGVLEKTLRLTGSTGAEKFSLILAPQLRGSRSGFGRGGPSGSFSRGGSGGSSQVQSRASSTNAGGASGGSSGAGGMSAGGSLASSAGAAGGVSNSRGASAMRASTSRVSSGSSRSSSSSSSASQGAAAASASMGGEGLGSTSGSLSGGSGGPPSIGSSGGSSGRGGSSEFSLVLQKAAPSGSLVKKGDVIAEFDRESMITRLNDYEASVIQSEASFKKMKADLNITKKAHDQSILAAKGEYEKAALNLKTTPVMSAIETERIKLALEEADARYKQLLKEINFVEAGIQADVKVAEIELEKSKVELKRAEVNADRMLMTAPIGGLVVMQNTFRGSEFDQVKQGDQLFPGQPFMQIVDTSSMVVNAVVNQLDVEKIRIGLRAKVRFDAFPDLVLPARISGIGSVGKSSRYRPDFLKEMSVQLKLDKLDPRVIPDLSVSCDVILESEEEAAIVPRESVFFESASAAEEGAGAYVLVQKGEEWLKRPVELGRGNFVSVAVKSGVKPGEVVALEKPATPVKV